jgi:hypothetical protein
MNASVISEIVLDRELRNGVRRLRILLEVLEVRRRGVVPVERPSRRSEHDASLRRVLAHRLEQVERAENVHARVVRRILDAATHVHLRREVRQHVGLRRRDQLRRLGVADVELVEGRSLREIRAFSRDEVVDDMHGPAFAQKPLGEMRSDEPRPAGDDRRRHQRWSSSEGVTVSSSGDWRSSRAKR